MMGIMEKVEATVEPMAAYEQVFRAQTLTHEGPEWLQVKRQQAFSRFEHLGFPTRHLEDWKYINLRPILSTPFEPYDSAVETKVSYEQVSAHFIPGTYRLVLVNGYFVPALSTWENHQGVVAGDLKTALESNVSVIQKYLAGDIASEADPFVALNTALFQDGILIHVGEDVTLDKPIQVLHFTTGRAHASRVAYPRVLVVAERNANVNLILQYVGLEANQYFNNTVHEVFAAENAQVELTYSQNESPTGHHLARTYLNLEANSRVFMTNIALDGNICRHSVLVNLLAEGADCTLNGLNVLNGETQVFNHSVINHQVPHCTSHQFYKGILDERSKSEFDATIFVERGANGTNSLQLNKNLLLSEEARVYTRPQLQILADDVKCNHGATVGQLDEEQLFYLASRGLEKELAQCLLTYGFVEEIVEKLTFPALRDYLDRWLLKNMGQENNPARCELTCRGEEACHS